MEPMTLGVDKELQHYGMCDASGAIALDNRHFVVASDEDNILRVYDANHSGKPVSWGCHGAIGIDINDYFRNVINRKEADIEAGAQLDGIIYWVTSHGRNSKGERRPKRHQFFGMTVAPGNRVEANQRGYSDQPLTDQPWPGGGEEGYHTRSVGREGQSLQQVGAPYTQLVQDILRDRKLKHYGFEEAEKLPPKAEGGLNIEGLTATPQGELLIGFRNPIPQGKALLLTLKNPRELLGENYPTAIFGDPIELDLAGLGIRSIDYWEARHLYLIIAGAYGTSEQFCLYQWSGLDRNPQKVDVQGMPSDFRPESLLFYGSQSERFQILSDDGTIVRSKEGYCKEIEDRNHPQKYFRSLWVRAT